MGVTHAVGAALSAKVRSTEQVAAAFFGDGATSQGAVHEAMNLAAIWRLPVIFVCGNDGYAGATPVEYAVSAKSIAQRAAAYNMPGAVVDGQDVTAVYVDANAAVGRARAGGGPSLIECKTYRYYITIRAMIPFGIARLKRKQRQRLIDCIRCFREQVLTEQILLAEELDGIQLRCRQLLEKAVNFACESPGPEPSGLFTGVYMMEPILD